VWPRSVNAFVPGSCEQVPHRAYCLDIVAAAAGHDWFWADSSAAAAAAAVSAGGAGEAKRARQQLLRGVVGRCHDSAPAVRVRALGALCNLLEQVTP